jgi:hypothetical protein
MIINLLFTAPILLSHTFIYYLMYLFYVKITLSTTMFDIYTNIYVSDFFLNNYYYLWTQFFILPSLLLFILYKHEILRLKYKNTLKTFILTLSLVLITYWVWDYYLLNIPTLNIKNLPYFFNTLLANPLNKYHPVLFFTSYILIYSLVNNPSFYVSVRTYFKLSSYSITQYKNQVNKINIYWVIMTTALYLGSWWALQEGSWGGWWNWDASEVFGLVILTFLLTIFHGQTLKLSLFYRSALLW